MCAFITGGSYTAVCAAFQRKLPPSLYVQRVANASGNRQKRYLNGSYGAVPELSMRLFEQAVASRRDERAE